MRTKIETITPERAQRDLAAASKGGKRSVNFRPLRPGHVRRLARALLNGGWDENGETIKYDDKDRLVDGQHRFAACVKANKSFKTVVVYGVDSVVDVDSGLRRSVAQVLTKMRGTKHSSLLARTLRVMARYEAGRIHMKRSGNNEPSNREVLEGYDRHQGLSDSVERYAGSAHVCRVAGLAFAHYVMRQTSPRLADAYFDQIAFGGGSRKSPANMVREKLLELRARNLMYDQNDELAAILRGLKYFVEGRVMKRVWGSRKGARSWDERSWPGFPSKEDAKAWEMDKRFA
jgi:hypothetical protein